MGGSSPITGSKVPVGNNIDYFCRPGYIVNGSVSAICEGTGNFSNSTPNCIKRAAGMLNI